MDDGSDTMVFLLVILGVVALVVTLVKLFAPGVGIVGRRKREAKEVAAAAALFTGAPSVNHRIDAWGPNYSQVTAAASAAGYTLTSASGSKPGSVLVFTKSVNPYRT